MILVVAATEAELCGHDGLVSGVGPVEAGAATARALALRPFAAVLHVGIAGARRASGIPIGSFVVGSEAVYEDLTARLAPKAAAPAKWLVDPIATLLASEPRPIGTTAAVGGGHACPVEAMEGFAVLRAAQLANVPAVEVRVVSNLVEDNRGDWRIAQALVVLEARLPDLVACVLAALTARDES